MRRRRGLVMALAVTAGLIAPAPASAAITAVFAGHTVSRAAIPCTSQPDGTRVCHGTYGSASGSDLRVTSFDGQPLAVYVTLPPSPSVGPDGPTR